MWKAHERRSEWVDVVPRDEGIVLRLRGPYNLPAVDFWPTTGTMRVVGIHDAPAIRRVQFHDAEQMAFNGSRVRQVHRPILS